MKACLVSEKLDFERGMDPRTFMGIGKSYIDNQFIEETEWAFPYNDVYNLVTVIELIKDYKGFPILILRKNVFHQENIDSENKRYLATTTNYQTECYTNPKGALKDIKFEISLTKLFNRRHQ